MKILTWHRIIWLFACVWLITSATCVVSAETNQVAVVPVNEDHIAIPVSSTGTLGQDFIALTSFNTLLLSIPTWSTTNSSFTFILRKQGPSGAIIWSQEVHNATDNRSVFTVPTQGIGRYYAEISIPLGQIGWWTRGDVYDRGTAYLNGKPLINQDRELIISQVQ